MIGKTLGHYRITSQLGKGGMGEVYLRPFFFGNRGDHWPRLPKPWVSRQWVEVYL